ncbi:triple tyrosine motif-containing protein [Pseudochryseolinea flava]|uniref:Two component regulator three Y domain-containing protein n=1 Tax=Pseudochryseolinea flava TaxID=2059302 RepID=A0A364Y9Q1_9BACT|nr:triple tyrosine motif-containing protein [Pseudochryseolinea flava]RAW03175.1 hypothetical protein DQQ10_03530 [Pseudochryseolinea flava]
MRKIFLFIALLWCFQAAAQNGNYFLSHYSPGENHSDNVCFDMVQDPSGMVYFATRRGIQRFDGRNWKMITGQGSVYSLQLTSDGQIVWAGAAGFGKLESNGFGDQRLVTLSSETRDVFECVVIQRTAYFVTETQVFVYNLDSNKTDIIPSTNLTGALVGIFELFGSAYLNTERGGVIKIDGQKFSKSGFKFPENEEVIFSCAGDRQYLIALSDNRILLCNENQKIREIKIQDSSYVDASVIVSGSFVNKDLFVLGTLRGGMIFIQTATGRTQEIINYNTGLPDNEVYALMIDRSQGIWASHEYGFTRVAPYLPFRSFGHYPGLSGNLLCATSFEGNVYVGTSLGLFKLEKQDVYDEIVYYVDVEIKRSGKTSEPVHEKDLPETPPTTETESKKKSFWKFFKKSKTTSPVEDKAPLKKDNETTAPKSEEAPRYQKIKKTERVLRASQFVYKKVSGVDAKVTQLVSINNSLIAIGLGGAYEINGVAAKPILEEPVRMAYASRERQTLFLSTYADELKTYQSVNGAWLYSDALENLDDRITSIMEGERDELWFLSINKVYRLQFSGKTVAEIETIDVSNPKFDEQLGVHLGRDIYLVNSEGFFKLDRSKSSFALLDSLPKPLHYFAGDGGIFFNDSHTWSTFGLEGQQNLKLMNLLHDIRYVNQERNTENLWVITSENELYKFFGNRFTPYEDGFPLKLKSVTGNVTINKREVFELDQEKSALNIEFVQPDFLAAQAIEYRYQLKGLDKTWSDWSSQNDAVDFAYLPAGDYSFNVQSRDIFGNIKEFGAVPFEVLPPYWKRPWFYALEFFVFAALVMLSFRLSTRFRIISRLLSLLTIIMLIQFIQTVIGEMFSTKTSPVIDFFVQVVVAFMILPVEGYLRNLMLRSLDSKSRLHKFLSPKSNLASGGDEAVP